MKNKSKIRFYVFITMGMLFMLTNSCKKELYTKDQPIADVEGNVYKTVKIGTQIWMAENLKTTKMNDGTAIPHVNDYKTWSEIKTPCFISSQGTLYNAYCVDAGNLCPTGWHVPTYNEMVTLLTYLGGASVAGGKMKSVSSLWDGTNKGGTNESGFSAEPYGYATSGRPDNLWLDMAGHCASFRAAGDYVYYLYIGSTGVDLDYSQSKNGGKNVRCLKD